MESESKNGLKRRDFLRALGLSAAATTVPLASEAMADTETSDEKRKTRYQESEHVKNYYRVNKYPA